MEEKECWCVILECGVQHADEAVVGLEDKAWVCHGCGAVIEIGRSQIVQC